MDHKRFSLHSCGLRVFDADCNISKDLVHVRDIHFPDYNYLKLELLESFIQTCCKQVCILVRQRNPILNGERGWEVEL